MGKLNRRKLCECNTCGLYVKPGRRFISGHNKGMLGKHHTEETLQNMRKPHGPMSEEAKQNMRGPKSEEAKQNMRIATNKPEVKEKRALTNARSEVKEKKFQSLKIAMNKPETKMKCSQSATIAQNKPEVKEKHRQACKIAQNKPEQKEKISQAQKKNWQDPIFVKKQMKARHVKQNKTEKKLEKIVTNLLPNEYKFVGHGEVVIAGKCPDFININGQKKIIELYGDYWHKGQDPQDRIDIFAKYGYDTLIIWEHELEDLDKLKIKLNNFHLL